MARREIDDYYPTIMVETEVDMVVSRGPVLVYGISVTGSGGAGEVVLRSGTSDKGTALARVGAVDTTTRHRNFSSPVYLANGAFLDVGANSIAGVQYAPAPQKPVE